MKTDSAMRPQLAVKPGDSVSGVREPWHSRLADRGDAAVANPFFAGLLIVAVQLRVMWKVWDYRDLTTGDTSSYFLDAVSWTHGLHDDIVWSPLYTNFFGTVVAVVGSVPDAVMAHRVLIVFAATLLVLALMRALLGPALGLVATVWWAILPTNFDVEYEVHLFGLLPVLIAGLVVIRYPGRAGRGAAFAILAGTTLLLRNELGIATLIVGAAIAIAEIRGRRQVAVPRLRYVFAYLLPLLVVFLLVGGAYWRSTVKGQQVQSAFRAKHDLNVCQVYAFSYQQEYPSRFLGSPWSDCTQLMVRQFGMPMPSFTQAARANPGAIARFVAWNVRLLPSGIQVSLFGATATGDNPGYFPVREHRPYALVFLLLLLLTIVAGWIAAARDRAFWLGEWLPPRLWGIVMLAGVAVTTLVVALTQRPRPEYLYGLTVTLLALAGSSVLALLRRFGIQRGLGTIALGGTLLLCLALPSYYHPAPRPLRDAVERLQVVRAALRRPGSVLVSSGYGFETCAYLAADPDRHCMPTSWTDVKSDVGTGRTLPEALSNVKASVIYADPALQRDPSIAQLLARPHGWRRVAGGLAADGRWSVLVSSRLRPSDMPHGARRQRTPQVLDRIPRDLSSPGVITRGILKDGWMERNARVVIGGGAAGRLVLRMQVSALRHGKTQHVRILLDGRIIATRRAHPGLLQVDVPVPATSRRRSIDVLWSGITAIGPTDPRRAAALLKFVGVGPSKPPTSLSRFPGDLARPGSASTGIFADGWVEKSARVQLAGGPPAELTVRAYVPPHAGQRLAIVVNGHRVSTTTVDKPAFRLAVLLPAAKRNRQIELQWTFAHSIGPSDPRRAAALLKFIGISRRR